MGYGGRQQRNQLVESKEHSNDEASQKVAISNQRSFVHKELQTVAGWNTSVFKIYFINRYLLDS